MNLLSEEIEEYQKEGELLIFMDGNGKIGLMGEEKSRNGKLLESVFEEHNLVVFNRNIKCVGKVTRQNTSQNNQKSAIDFVVMEESIENNVESMKIDEEGIIRMKGEKDSDHNTITLTLKIDGQDVTKPTAKTQWRLNAPENHWKKFRHELSKLEDATKKLFRWVPIVRKGPSGFYLISTKIRSTKCRS